MWEETLVYDSVDMYRNEIDSFVRCIRSGEKNASHIDQVIITARMMQAIHGSSDTGQEMVIDW